MYYNKEKKSVFGNVPYRIVLLSCGFTELSPAKGNKGLIELPETQCWFPEIHGEIYSGYGKYSDPLKFFTLCYIAAIC